MIIREYIYQSNIDFVKDLSKLLEEVETGTEEFTREDVLKAILGINSNMVEIKKHMVEEVIALIDRIDVNLLNHKVPKNKLKR